MNRRYFYENTLDKCLYKAFDASDTGDRYRVMSLALYKEVMLYIESYGQMPTSEWFRTKCYWIEREK